MKKILLATAILLCSTGVWGKRPVQAYDPYGEQELEQSAPAQSRSNNSKSHGKNQSKVLSGMSFGLLGNIGYAFSSNPEQAYNNGSITELSDYSTINKSNVSLGVGAMGRLHFLEHIHLGAEGYLSMMPMMKTGSSIRHGYAGALIDGYLSLGGIVLELGTGLGGGKVKRMFVPEETEGNSGVVGDNGMVYNASYTTTPYFYLDPYIGLEVHFAGITGLMIKLDYVLPFGKADRGYLGTIDLKNWSSFITPSGPRLHIGLLLGGK